MTCRCLDDSGGVISPHANQGCHVGARTVGLKESSGFPNQTPSAQDGWRVKHSRALGIHSDKSVLAAVLGLGFIDGCRLLRISARRKASQQQQSQQRGSKRE